MFRLLIATTCALGSCAAPTANTVHIERELGVLAASVRRLESRIAAEANLAAKHREDEPPRPPAGRRRDDRAPARPPGPVPIAETGPATRRPEHREPERTEPRRTEPPGQPEGPDPVRELAAEVARFRGLLRAKPRKVTEPRAPAQDPTPQRRITPPPAAPPAAPDSNAARGRFQITGSGRSAWQTVLDTHTGVIYNYRFVGGRNVWVPITTPVRVDMARH